MPSRHIPDATWAKVEKETYKVVVKTGKVIKELDMLDYLINKALSDISEDDYEHVASKKPAKAS